MLESIHPRNRKLLLRGVLGLALAACVLAPSKAGADPGVVVRISELPEPIQGIEQAGGVVWIWSESGLHRVRGHGTTPVLENPPPTAIAPVGDTLWVGTRAGLYEVEAEDERAHPPALRSRTGAGQEPSAPLVGEEAVQITALASRGERAWVGTYRGLFEVDAREGQVTPVDPAPVLYLRRIGHEIWVSTARGIYSIEDDGTTRPIEPRQVIPVLEMERAGGALWVVTSSRGNYGGPVYRIENGRAVEVTELRDFLVISVAEIDGEAWFATSHGVFRLREGTLEKVEVPGLKGPVNTVTAVDGKIWIGGLEHAFCCQIGRFEPLPPLELELSPDERDALGRECDLGVTGFASIEDTTWLLTEAGAYRYDEDVRIKVEPNTVPVFGTTLLLGPDLELREMRYEGPDHSEPYGGVVDGLFEVVIEPDRESFQEQVRSGRFVPAESFRGNLRTGVRDLHIMARDQFGNSVERTIPGVVVLPRERAIQIVSKVFFFAVLPLLLLFTIVRFSSRCKVFMSWLMIPGFWKLATVGGLLIAGNRTRRWILDRYARELRRSLREADVAYRKDAGERSRQLATDLANHRTVLLVGEAADSGAVFQALMGSLVAADPAWTATKRPPIPISLDLQYHAESRQAIESGLCGRLADWGGITNEKVALRMLRDSRDLMVFLLRGLDELSNDERRSVAQFIDRYAQRSYIAVSTTEKTAFARIERVVPVSSLSADEGEETRAARKPRHESNR